MKYLIQKSSLIVMLSLVCQPVMAGNFIDDIEGVYVEKGSATFYPCAPAEPDCHLVPMEDSTNCVVIKKESDKIAHVFLNFVGENGHSCTIDAEENFEIRKDSLFFSDHDEVAEDQPQLKTDGIYVFKKQKNISFKVQPDSLADFYCGIIDYLNGYSISTTSRHVPWKEGVAPPKDAKSIDKYCPKFNQQ
ncbi:MAG TPA: hypothetical protein VIE65_00665 [Methylobacter sp.]|jgi:hypothetical protein